MGTSVISAKNGLAIWQGKLHHGTHAESAPLWETIAICRVSVDGLTKSSMASLMADMLSTNTNGITVASGSKEDTAGINYCCNIHIKKKKKS